MIKILFMLVTALLLLATQGCHSLKVRKSLDVKETLFVNINKIGKNFSVKDVSNISGDVNLKTLQLSSDAVMVRLCGEKDNSRCLDQVLDVVENGTNRKGILASYNHLLQKNKEHQEALEKLHTKYAPSYKEDSKKVTLRYLVNDETKFYKGEELPFEEILYLGLNDLKYPAKALHRKEINDLFPHSILKLQSEINRVNERLLAEYEKDLRVYKRTIQNRSTFYPLVRRASMKEGPFSFKIRAPKIINRKEVRKERVIFNIIGKDIHDLYPYAFESRNRDLKVSFNKRNTSFANLSGEEMTLESITFFYNGYNQTTLLGRDFSFSELNIGSTTSTPSNFFFTKRFKQAAFFPALSEAKAKREKVKFGIEVKYKIEGRSGVKVLSSAKKELIWRFITGY